MTRADLPFVHLKAFLSCLILVVLVGCATTAEDDAGVSGSASGPVPSVAGKKKTDAQESRFIKEISRALEQGKVDTADALLVRLLYVKPKSLEARLARGEINLARNRYRLAKQVFEQLISEQKLLARAYQGMGIASLQLRDHDDAISHLKEAVSRDGELWRAWNSLGYLYDTKRDWKKANEAYNHAIALRRDKATIFNNRGFSKLMQSDYKAAAKDFKEALKIDVNLAAARMNLRLALAWLGRYVEAVSGVPKTELPKVLNNVGYIAMIKGEYAATKAYFSRAMEVSPSFNITASGNLQKLEALRSQKRQGRSGR